MALPPGTRVGPYEVVTLLGTGGMGEVHRARDTRLGREVAIKILPDVVADDPERMLRFEREARLLASLSHPNIATLHALEQVDGRHLLVMELVPGDDLSARIDGGAIPLPEALQIAQQLASALETAHDQGVIHRDLKPANIKVTADGVVKVLDFGLAKAFSNNEASSTDVTHSPTLTAHATQAGIIMGTAAYMSPEQARGRAADRRADVWAFGVVLFEMLTGRRLFDGETTSDTLAAVLRQEVDWALLPATTPEALRRLVRRCLDRDRKNRLHDMGDARIAIDDIVREGPVATPTANAPSRFRRFPGWALAGVAAAALGVGFGFGRWSAARPIPEAPFEPTRFSIAAPSDAEAINWPAISQDGRIVVFEASTAGEQSLYLNRFDEMAPRVLPRTAGGSAPFFSPDGRWVGFRRPRGTIEKISIEGGEPLTIFDPPSHGPGAAWGPDGSIVYSQAWLGGLSIVSSDGGAARVLTTPDEARQEKGHWWPEFLPRGRGVLFTIWKAASGLNDAEVAILDLATGQYRTLLRGARATYVAPGYLIFYRAGVYHAVRFDLDQLAVQGETVRVLEDAQPLAPQGNSAVSVAVSPGGTLTYLPGRLVHDRELAWVSADGRIERLPFPARAIAGASLSPDGHRAAVSVQEGGRLMIRVLDLQRGTDEPLDVAGSNWNARWHPDGQRLAFLSMRKGDFDIYVKDLASGAPPEPLLDTSFDEMPRDWLPDGRSIVVDQSSSDGSYDLKLFTPGESGDLKQLTRQMDVSQAAVSPDGRWLAFIAGQGGRREAFVRSLFGETAPQRISQNGAEAVDWLPRRGGLVYAKNDEIWSASCHENGTRFELDEGKLWARVPLLDGSTDRFDAAPDGRVLVALRKDPALPPQLRVVLNWRHEIARRLE